MRFSRVFGNGIFAVSALSVFLTPFTQSFAQDGGNPGQSSLMGLLPFILLFVLFYFLIIRPQQKRSRQREKMLKELKRGDHVLTNGGIYATITEIGQGDTISLEIAKGITVKASVSAVASKAGETPDKKVGG